MAKDAKGQTIDELVISLRLSLDEWENDYKAAGDKVRKAAAQLAAENKASRIQLQIETLGADAAKGKISSFNNQVEILNTMIARQRNTVAMTSNAWKDASTTQGASSKAAMAMQAVTQKEQLALAKLEAQLRTTTAARKDAYNAIANNVLNYVNNAALALTGVGAASVALAVKVEQANKMFEISFKSSSDEVREWSETTGEAMGVQSDELRKYATSMNMLLDNMGFTRSETVEFSKTISELSFNLAAMRGQDPQEVFEKLRAGVAGQTRGLKELNIYVNDAIVEQYAYANGIAAQDTKLTEHQQALARLGVILKQTGDATNYMATHSDDAVVKTMRLKAQTEDLAEELGKDLLPTYKEILEVLSDFAKVLKNVQDELPGATAQMIWAAGEMKVWNMMPMPPWLKAAGDIVIAAGNLGVYAIKAEEAAKANETLYLTGQKPGPNQANVRWNEELQTFQKETLEIVTNMENGIPEQIRVWKELSAIELEDLNKRIEDMKARGAPTAGMSEAELAREAAKQEQLRKEEESARKKQVEDITAVNAETYKLTHNNVQAELKDIEMKAEKYRKEKVDEATIAEWAESAKAKVYREFEDNVNSQVNAAFQSGLQNRLDGIDRERRAWIQKGVEEVQATKWAEAEKQKAVSDAALQAIQQHRDYLKLISEFNKVGFASVEYTSPGGTKVYDTIRNKNDLLKYIVGKEREKAGIGPDDNYTSQDFVALENMMKDVKNNLIPGLSSMGRFGPAGVDSRGLLSLIAGGFSTADKNGVAKPTVVNPQINVNIDHPQVSDERDIAALADKVADKITPAVKQAIGADTNTY